MSTQGYASGPDTAAPLPEPAAILARTLTLEATHGSSQRRLLDHISFSVSPGQFAGIIGPSGCGKSTLLKVVGGLLSPTGGSIHLAGYPVRELRKRFPLAIGYLPQFSAFHGELTIREILTFAAALRLPPAVSKRVKTEWLDYIIELSGIHSILGQPYHTLSGGQMRRVALAEELIGDPPFLLLDELTSGLDPHSEREMMLWLNELASKTGKTILLVTHALGNIHLCNTTLLLAQGRLLYQGPYAGLLPHFQAADIEAVYSRADTLPAVPAERPLPHSPEPQPLKTAPPPGCLHQLPALVHRQCLLLWRDRGQLLLQLVLIVSFPTLVAIFAYRGLPQVRSLSLGLEPNVVRTLTEQLLYLKELFHAASLISGLAMFQVILLTLMGANNGSREIAKERPILDKERRGGLSSGAYTSVKLLQITTFSAIQAFWMTWFVKTICGFSGDYLTQATVFFAATLAMSTTCLAISARSPSAERASLLAIYLVGLQLPLSGAILALPELVNWLTRPFISAYWGWSGYLRSLETYRQYDIVKQTTDADIASLPSVYTILLIHIGIGILVTYLSVARTRQATHLH